MAIFIPGKTTCVICSELIDLVGDAVAMPPFLRNTHPLWRYSDGIFHKKCFEQSHDRDEVVRLFQLCEEIMKDAPSSRKEYERWVKEAFSEFA